MCKLAESRELYRLFREQIFRLLRVENSQACGFELFVIEAREAFPNAGRDGAESLFDLRQEDFQLSFDATLFNPGTAVAGGI